MKLLQEVSDRLRDNGEALNDLKQTIARMVISWDKPLRGHNTDYSCFGIIQAPSDFEWTPYLPKRMQQLSRDEIAKMIAIGAWSEVDLNDEYGFTGMGSIVFPPTEELGLFWKSSG